MIRLLSALNFCIFLLASAIVTGWASDNARTWLQILWCLVAIVMFMWARELGNPTVSQTYRQMLVKTPPVTLMAGALGMSLATHFV